MIITITIIICIYIYIYTNMPDTLYIHLIPPIEARDFHVFSVPPRFCEATASTILVSLLYGQCVIHRSR